MKRITEEERARAMSEYLKTNTVTKLPAGQASGARMGGSICAATYGESAMGRAQGRAREWAEWKEKKAKTKRHNEKMKKKHKGRKATPKQIGFIKFNNLVKNPDKLQSLKFSTADRIIGSFVRVEALLEKQARMRQLCRK